MGLLLAIPGLLSGLFGTLNGITAAISNAQIAKINATTEEEKIRADQTIQTLQARRDVMIAESSHSRLNGIMRFLFGLVALSVVMKLYLWDKVIGSLAGCSQAPAGTCGIFTTDPLDDNAWKIIMMVMGFYFISEVSLGVTRIVKSR